MPPCQHIVSTLSRNRGQAVCFWQLQRWTQCCPVRRSYGTAPEASHTGEAAIPQEHDHGDTTLQDDYLDFLLGPSTVTDNVRARLSPRDVHASTLDTRLARSPPRVSINHDSVKSTTSPKAESQTYPHRVLPRMYQTINASHRKTQVRNEEATLDQEERSNDYEVENRAEKANDIKIRAAELAHRTRNTLQDRGVPTFTHLVPLRSGTRTRSAFSLFWNTQYARIRRHYEKDGALEQGIPRQPPTLHPEAQQWASVVWENIHTGSKNVFAGINGQSAPKAEKFNVWQNTALWFLYHEPERMLAFLKATHAPPYTPVTYVQDSLRYLALHFSRHADLKTSKTHLGLLANALPTLSQREDGERLTFENSEIFRRVIPHCSRAQVKRLYHAIKTNNILIAWPTYLHFAHYFAKNDHLEQGLNAVLEAKDQGAELASMGFLSCCATLLRTAIRQPGGFRTCLRIVDNLVGTGMKLNTQLCNIVMLNAVEAGELKTAFDVYSSFTQHGIQPDAYTFAILLKGCKLAIDDVSILNTTIRDAISFVQVRKEPVVATEMLHCLALHHAKYHPATAFNTVAEAYAQMFDTRVLRQLGISSAESKHQSGERMQPSLQPIGVLLASYLNHSFEQSQSAWPAYELYRRFRHLANAGVEPFASLIQEVGIMNTFLISLIKTKKGLLYASELVKDMQQIPEPLGITPRCAPNVQTWSIFLSGFTRHGQMELAEQVLAYMKRQGIEPNEVTWNTLLTGYHNRRDAESALDVVRRMEAGTAVWDDWVSSIRRGEGLHENETASQEGRAPAQVDFTADLKAGLAKKLSVAETSALNMREKAQTHDIDTADSPADLAERASSYIPFKP